MGEYILNINARVMRRPLVVEERRINFDEPEKEKTDKDVQEKDGQDEQAKSEGENLKG